MHPVSLSKSAVILPLSRFSKPEREMISIIYQYDPAGDDREGAEAFRRTMQRFWGYLSG